MVGQFLVSHYPFLRGSLFSDWELHVSLLHWHVSDESGEVSFSDNSFPGDCLVDRSSSRLGNDGVLAKSLIFSFLFEDSAVEERVPFSCGNT